MICAYDRNYLENARVVLARMLDFAVNDLCYDIEVFYEMFLNSKLAGRFETGDAGVVAGRSGVELAYDIMIEKIGILEFMPQKPTYMINKSIEYWTGYVLAYYQWKTGKSFRDINRYVPIKDVRALYSPYHEMDISQFVDKMDAMYKSAKNESNLKILRQNAGISQSRLAVLSGIPLRSIQEYEQRRKDINKAQIETVYALAQALACDMKDLLE